MNGGRREEAKKEAADEVAARNISKKLYLVPSKEGKLKSDGENWDLSRNQVALVSTGADEGVAVIMGDCPRILNSIYSFSCT